jgi:hypothetical protein
MRIRLVDPYYLAGHSPPSWVLGQLEATLIQQGHATVVSDFVPAIDFARLIDFQTAEQQFIRHTAEFAGHCDAVYITTSFGIPQKPTPILRRVDALAETIKQNAPGIPLIVGGDQIEYLSAEAIDPFAASPGSPITAFVRHDAHLLPLLADDKSRGALSSSGAWTGASNAVMLPDWARRPVSNAASREPAHCTWAGWDLTTYPPYRALLTSLGCRYSCSFCFESKQQFQSFDFASVVRGSVHNGRNLMAIEDSTIVGAHGLRGLSSAIDGLDAGIEFTCYALVSEIDRVSHGDLRQLRERGMASVILGIKTPDSGALRLYKKNVQPDRVRRVIGKLHGAGISTQGCLMMGIPEVNLSDTLYTLEYAFGLDIDVRRWHIFQHSFTHQPERLRTSQQLSVKRFAKLPVNVPDNLIPELFEDAAPELFLEEHLLIRAIPHVTDFPDQLDEFRYQAGYTLGNLYKRIVSSLRGTKYSFNEEDYYRVLTLEHEMYSSVVDRNCARKAVS